MKRNFQPLFAIAIAAACCAAPGRAAQGTACPSTPDDLLVTLNGAATPARARAAQCFVERSVSFPLAKLDRPIALLLQDPDPSARRAGLEMIASAVWAGTASDAQVSRAYASRLQGILQVDGSARNRVLAATLLVHLDALHEGRLRGPLMRLLADSDPVVSDAALDNLIKLGLGTAPGTTTVLISKANSRDQQQRRLGYRGLGRTHANQRVGAEILQILRRGLRDEPLESRIQAAHALGALHRGGAAAETDLQAIVWDPRQPARLRRAAQDAVELITGKPIRAPWVTDAPLPEAPEGAAGSVRP